LQAILSGRKNHQSLLVSAYTVYRIRYRIRCRTRCRIRYAYYCKFAVQTST
jgi:hypothetical protein